MSLSHEQTINHYLESYKAFEKSLNGDSSLPIHSLRDEAITRFAEMGFPTKTDEEWRFTNVSEIAAKRFEIPTLGAGFPEREAKTEKFVFEDLKGPRLVFINGIFAKNLSRLTQSGSDVIVKQLSSALSEHPDLVSAHLGRYISSGVNGFAALSLAFMRDGLFLSVPDGVVLEDAIQVLFVSTEAESEIATYPRNLMIVGSNCRVSIVESYVCIADDSYFTNAVTEIVVGENSVVEHDKFQNESVNAFHIAATHIHQAAHSNYVSNSIAVGGRLVRNDITAVLDAERSECTLNGLSVATGNQLIDNHTTIDHAKANCQSHELYKAVLDGNARGVFNGKIFVRKDAQKTDAKQTNQTLLLSDDATIDTKPQLEIFADDVKCTHGATVGQLDSDQLFYLRTRGIPESKARDILTFAFASDVVSRVKLDALRDQLEAFVHAKLDASRRTNGS
ncbi:MAG: Fe-S cluster assembly protein SufD [Ignavibacteria bacterium]|nr:Fe-S cluster assembly protein SufD [Ignavibacteria bacterium]